VQLRKRSSEIDCSVQKVKNRQICNRFIAISSSSSKSVDETECDCVEPCYSIIYSAFVQSRRKLYRAEPGAKLYIYYTSKLVTNIEELPGYDWSQFVADMGGSVGFLLGLSVIAVIVVLEKILGHLFLNDYIERYKEKKRKREEREAKEKQVLD
jgi:hypothetical protein